MAVIDVCIPWGTLRNIKHVYMSGGTFLDGVNQSGQHFQFN